MTDDDLLKRGNNPLAPRMNEGEERGNNPLPPMPDPIIIPEPEPSTGNNPLPPAPTTNPTPET